MSAVQNDLFLRGARLIGDFGSPFYDEERHRDVWNEAAAFGLQLVLWTTLLGATAVVWVVGREAVPYALGALMLLGLCCGAAMAYAQRLGVGITDARRVLRMRLVPYVALLGLLAVGVVRSGADGASPSFAVGMAVGALAAVACLVVGARRARGRTDT